MTTFLVVIFGAFGIVGLRATESVFGAISGRAWAGITLLFAFGLALTGVWLAVPRAPEAVASRCHVVSATVLGHGGSLRALVRVDWMRNGERFVMSEETELPIAAHLEAAELRARLREGARIPCYITRSKKTSVFFGPPPIDQRQPIGIGLLISAVGFAFAGLRKRRATRPASGPASFGLRGFGGLLCAVVILIGMLLRDHDLVGVGTALAIAGGVAAVGIAIREQLKASQVIRIIEARMTGAEPWPAPPSEDDDISNSLWDDQRLQGLWNGSTAKVAMDADGGSALVELAHWPKGLCLERGESEHLSTGDVIFDSDWRITADADERRLALSPKVRRLLIELAGAVDDVHIKDETIHLRLSADQVEDLPLWLDLAASIDQAYLGPLKESIEESLLSATRSEHIAAVRMQHYSWLAQRNWQAARVFRQAARDSDMQIAQWAREQLPPDDGVYR